MDDDRDQAEPGAAPRARVLLLPGWQDSGPGHWQTLWEAEPGFERVQQADWMWPRRGDWMARLEEVLLAEPRPALLAAHSLGCQLVAAWAAHAADVASASLARVAGALLVAPPDIEREDMPPQVAGWRPIARRALPFAATVVYSNDDPYCAPERALGMAASWGAGTVALSDAGHINADSGLGAWPQGVALLRALHRRRRVRSDP